MTIGGYTIAMVDQNKFDLRVQNTIQYWSPNWGGVAIRLMAQANENKTATSDPKDYGGSITYTGGPIYVFYAYEDHKDQVGDPGVSATAAGKKESAHAIGGTMAFGPLKAGLLGNRIKKSDREDQKAWMGNVVYTMGNNQLIYQYSQDKGGFAPGTLQLDCKAHVAGWQYNFSKRTFFLGQYAKVKNENTRSNCGSATFMAFSPGQDPHGVSLGISHVF